MKIKVAQVISCTFLSDFGLDPQGLNPIAIAVVPERFVEFREFNPILDIDVRSGHSDRFNLEAEITLGDNTNGILPSKEIVTLRVGTYSVVLPAGAFKQMKRENKEFHFRGKVNGVVLDVTLESEDANEYELMVFARGAKLGSVGNQVPVTLIIGNDRGSASMDTGKLCHNRDCK
jgi:hypothetical protein